MIKKYAKQWGKSAGRLIERDYDCIKAKNQLAKEILEMIGYKPPKSIHSDGVLNKRETFAVHQYIKHMRKKIDK